MENRTAINVPLKVSLKARDISKKRFKGQGKQNSSLILFSSFSSISERDQRNQTIFLASCCTVMLIFLQNMAFLFFQLFQKCNYLTFILACPRQNHVMNVVWSRGCIIIIIMAVMAKMTRLVLL